MDIYDFLDKSLYKITPEREASSVVNPANIDSGLSTGFSEMVSGGIKQGKNNFDNTETGFILGIDDGMAKFYIGNTTNYLNWTGTELIISGNITATSGAIGGWTINATSLTDAAGTVGMSSAVTAGDDIRFWAGNVTPGSAPFRVTEAGVLTATSATITGSITATSGNIGGWTINSTSLTDAAGTVGMSSAVTAGDDIRFWAGSATPASAPFRVTEAGKLTTSNVEIKTSTSGQRIEIASSDNTLRFYGASAQIIGIGTAAGSAIDINTSTSDQYGVSIAASNSGNGFYYTNSSNVACRGLYIAQTSSGASTTLPCVELHHDGKYYALFIDATYQSGGIIVTNSSTKPVFYATHESDSTPMFDLTNTGDGGGIYLTSSGSGKAIQVSNNGSGDGFYFGHSNNSGVPVYISHTATESGYASLTIARSSPDYMTSMTQSCNSADAAYGMYIAVTNSGAGLEYAFSFGGSEIVSSSVGGTQNKKIRVSVGGTEYYIPCYTA